MLVKMIREDGHEAEVHPEMVDDYVKGGYRAVQEKAQAEEVKPKRGRPRKTEAD